VVGATWSGSDELHAPPGPDAFQMSGSTAQIIHSSAGWIAAGTTTCSTDYLIDCLESKNATPHQVRRARVEARGAAPFHQPSCPRRTTPPAWISDPRSAKFFCLRSKPIDHSTARAGPVADRR